MSDTIRPRSIDTSSRRSSLLQSRYSTSSIALPVFPSPSEIHYPDNYPTNTTPSCFSRSSNLPITSYPRNNLRSFQTLGLHGAFWFYAAVAVCGLCFVVCCVPETKGKQLDEMNPDYAQAR